MRPGTRCCAIWQDAKRNRATISPRHILTGAANAARPVRPLRGLRRTGGAVFSQSSTSNGILLTVCCSPQGDMSPTLVHGAAPPALPASRSPLGGRRRLFLHCDCDTLDFSVE